MKVADLKAVLQQANVTFDSKLTKPALIKKIMETPEAAAIASAPDEAVAADDDMVSYRSATMLQPLIHYCS